MKQKQIHKKTLDEKQKQKEINYKDDVNHGKVSVWNENGDLFLEGNFIEDKRDGKWSIRWLSTDEDVSIITYKDDEPWDGVWYEYGEEYQNYPLKKIVSYKNGIRNGRYENWNDLWLNEEGYITGTYKNGIKDGVWKTFHNKDREIKEIMNYKDGLLHGKYEQFDRNHDSFVKGNYKNDKRVGDWVIQRIESYDRYYKSIVLKKYNDGLLDGYYCYYLIYNLS